MSTSTVKKVLSTNNKKQSKHQRLTTAEHIKELADRGIEYKLVGEYNGRKKKSSYFCARHNQTLKAAAGKIIEGGSLRCCYEESRGKTKLARHAASYASELAKHGIVVLRDTYTGDKERLWHFCLVHKEFHKGTPAAQPGGGLACCRNASTKSISERQIMKHANAFRIHLKRQIPITRGLAGLT